MWVIQRIFWESGERLDTPMYVAKRLIDDEKRPQDAQATFTPSLSKARKIQLQFDADRICRIFGPCFDTIQLSDEPVPQTVEEDE